MITEDVTGLSLSGKMLHGRFVVTVFSFRNLSGARQSCRFHVAHVVDEDWSEKWSRIGIDTVSTPRRSATRFFFSPNFNLPGGRRTALLRLESESRPRHRQ
jgi:hypothetical protein